MEKICRTLVRVTSRLFLPTCAGTLVFSVFWFLFRDTLSFWMVLTPLLVWLLFLVFTVTACVGCALLALRAWQMHIGHKLSYNEGLEVVLFFMNRVMGTAGNE